MKKKYCTPNMNTVQMNCNNILCGSMKLDLNSDESINNEADIWSNSESIHNIWD